MKTPSASTFPSTRAIPRAIISFKSALLTSSPNTLTARSTSARAMSGKNISAPTDSAASLISFWTPLYSAPQVSWAIRTFRLTLHLRWGDRRGTF